MQKGDRVLGMNEAGEWHPATIISIEKRPIDDDVREEYVPLLRWDD